MLSSLPKTPRWFIWIVVLVGLPIFQFPYLLSICPDNAPWRVLLWFYPFYVVMSCWLAWQCYPQRPALAWILLLLTVLSHAGVWLLDYNIMP